SHYRGPRRRDGADLSLSYTSILNLLLEDDPYPASSFNFSYRRLFTCNLLLDRTYVTVAYSPPRLDEARVVRLIVKGFPDGAHAFAQRVVVDVFAVPETIQ